MKHKLRRKNIFKKNVSSIYKTCHCVRDDQTLDSWSMVTAKMILIETSRKEEFYTTVLKEVEKKNTMLDWSSFFSLSEQISPQLGLWVWFTKSVWSFLWQSESSVSQGVRNQADLIMIIGTYQLQTALMEWEFNDQEQRFNRIKASSLVSEEEIRQHSGLVWSLWAAAQTVPYDHS